MKKSYEIDMTSARFWAKSFISIPLMLSGILQLLLMQRTSSWWAVCRQRGSGGSGIHIFAYQPIN